MRAKRNFSLIYWIYNLIYVIHIKAHNDQNWKGIESALLSSAERLKQSTSVIRPLIPSSNRKASPVAELSGCAL